MIETYADTPAAQAATPPYDDRPYATVLRENVKDGLVDYVHLAAHREPLDAYLAHVAVVGPQRTPDQFASAEHCACYYVNVYNAGMLAAVLQAGIPPSMYQLGTPPPDERFRLRVDGRRLRLGELRALARQHGDVRVLFALSETSMASPPLHNQPLRPGNLDDTLRLLARKAMDNHRVVTINHERLTLALADWMISAREGFLACYRQRTGTDNATMLNVVLHFASPARRQWLNTAVGYSVRIIPPDRRLNIWTRP